MLHKKTIMLVALLLVFGVGIWTATASSFVEQRAVLSGNVISVVQVGAKVSEGTELVRVNSLAGSANAARANTNGIVKEVLVNIGSEIKSGDVVVRIEAQ